VVKNEKKEIVEQMSKDIANAKVVAVVDLHTLPASLLHSLRKEMKGKGKVIINKTTLLNRALKKAKKDQLSKYVTGEKAILLSDLDPFMLYKKARGNPLKVYAKPNQTAPYDIIVPAGETMLPPGPVLSELKQAGVDARIQAGKIAVGKDSTVAKKGVKITDIIAKALQKLDIKPFELNVRIPAAIEGSILYTEDVLHVDEKEFLGKISQVHMGTYALSMEIGYVTKDNIKELLAKAHRNSRAVGIEQNIAVPELMEELLKKAARQASALESKIGA